MANAPERHLTGSDVQTLRERLGLSRKEFGNLLGVSAQVVLLWDRKGPEALQMQKRTYAAVERAWATAFGESTALDQAPAPEKKPCPMPKRLAYKKRRLAPSHRITGDRIKALRLRLGILQRDLAKLTGVKRQSVVAWESKGSGFVFLSKKTRPAVRAALKLGKRKAWRLLWNFAAGNGRSHLA